MPYHLAGQVTFSSNADRNRAKRSVEKLVNDWNSQHGPEQDFTQVRMLDVVIDGALGLDFEYTCPDQAAVELAHSAMHFDIDSNVYLQLYGLSIWLD